MAQPNDDFGPVGVLGGGSWGTSLAQLAATNGFRVIQWMRDAKRADEQNRCHENRTYLPDIPLSPAIEAITDLQRVGQECRLILVVVPSQSLRSVLYELGAHLDGGHLLVHGVKGLETGTFKRMSEILREETPCRQLGVLSGPNLAREVAMGQPSASVVASRYEAVIEATRVALTGPTFRVYGNADLVGVEIGGALKNILAIASGVVYGLGFGDNTKALLLTRGIAEIARLGSHLGANASTFSGLSGIGDLVATCFSPLSRNFQVGQKLAQGQSLTTIAHSMHQVAEGVKTTLSVYEYAQRQSIDMPITEAVYRMLYEQAKPAEVLKDLMSITRFPYEHS